MDGSRGLSITVQAQNLNVLKILTLISLTLNLIPSSSNLEVNPGSKCDQELLGSEDHLVSGPEANALDQLISRSTSSAVAHFPPIANNSDRYTHQRSFESICHGWRNYISRDQSGQPVAFWALDRQRSILLAKFIYYSPAEYFDIGQREALLLSPNFRLDQAISPNDSCFLNFSTYLTLPTHLDVHLLTLTDFNHKIRAKARHMVKKIVGRTIFGKRRVTSTEAKLWENHSIDLRTSLGSDHENKLFALEFSVPIGRVNSETIQISEFLNGVALANINLEPNCFIIESKLGENEDISSYIAQVSNNDEEMSLSDSSWSSQFWESFHGSQGIVSFLIFSIVIMIAFMSCIQLTLCAYFEFKQSENSPTTDDDQSTNTRILNIHERFCCICSLRKYYARVHRNYYERNKTVHDISGPRNNLDNDQLIRMNQLIKDESQNSDKSAQGSKTIDLEMLELAGYLDELNHAPESPKPRDLKQIDRCHLNLTTLLGRGAFGSVYQGELDLDPSEIGEMGMSEDKVYVNMSQTVMKRKVAIKMLSDDRNNKACNLREFICEALNLARAPHRNIVQLVGVCFVDKPFYIVMELMSGGSLKRLLVQHQIGQIDESDELTFGDLLVFSLDIARGCDFLRSKNMIHRDLATRNCLLTLPGPIRPRSTRPNVPIDEKNNERSDEINLDKVYLNGYRDSGMVVKLADFGMTRHLVEESNYYLMNMTKEVPVRWMAPECANYKAVPNSDVWSFGIVLWEIFSVGQVPYPNIKDNNDVLRFLRLLNEQIDDSTESSSDNIMDNSFSPPNEKFVGLTNTLVNNYLYQQPLERGPALPKPKSNTPDSIYSIMCACWTPNPRERPKFSDLSRALYDCLKYQTISESPVKPHSAENSATDSHTNK